MDENLISILDKQQNCGQVPRCLLVQTLSVCQVAVLSAPESVVRVNRKGCGPCGSSVGFPFLPENPVSVVPAF